MPGCPPKVKSGLELLIVYTMLYTHLPPADRERYTSEASTTTTSIVQRFERGLNEVGVTQYSPRCQYWRPLTRWSAGSRWSRRRRSWAAAACSGAARWAWQWAGHEGRYSHACLLNLFLQTEKKLYFGSGNQCYAGRSAGDACQVDSWSY